MYNPLDVDLSTIPEGYELCPECYGGCMEMKCYGNGPVEVKCELCKGEGIVEIEEESPTYKVEYNAHKPKGGDNIGLHKSHEIVTASANGKVYKYCRTCKVEVVDYSKGKPSV